MTRSRALEPDIVVEVKPFATFASARCASYSSTQMRPHSHATLDVLCDGLFVDVGGRKGYAGSRGGRRRGSRDFVVRYPTRCRRPLLRQCSADSVIES